MKPGRTIYVVVGSAGEYSDRNEWLVRAFDDEEAAKAFVLRASDKARELYAERQVQWYEKGNMDWRPISEYDPCVQLSYSGTLYYYGAVPLEETK